MSANNQQFQINDRVSVKVINEMRTHPLYDKSFDGRIYYITEDWINQSNRIEGKYEQIYIKFTDLSTYSAILLRGWSILYGFKNSSQNCRYIIDSITANSVIVYEHKYGIIITPLLFTIPFNKIDAILITQTAFQITTIT